MHNELIEKRINNFLELFDFEKVSQVMDSLRWTWQDQKKPDIEQMKILVAKLVEKSIKSKEENCIIASGGFEAIKIGEIIRISFAVTSLDDLDINYLTQD